MFRRRFERVDRPVERRFEDCPLAKSSNSTSNNGWVNSINLDADEDAKWINEIDLGDDDNWVNEINLDA